MNTSFIISQINFLSYKKWIQIIIIINKDMGNHSFKFGGDDDEGYGSTISVGPQTMMYGSGLAAAAAGSALAGPTGSALAAPI